MTALRTGLASTLLLATVTLAACSSSTTDLGGPFDLTFRGDPTFNEPHGGDPVEVALIQEGVQVVGRRATTVSATADPAFEVAFEDALQAGATFTVVFWIDSNIGGGSPGVCDPPEIDHQWSVSFVAGAGDFDLTVLFDTNLMSEVCDSF